MNEDVYGLDGIEAAWAYFTVWDDSEFDPGSPLARLFMPWFYHASASAPTQVSSASASPS